MWGKTDQEITVPVVNQRNKQTYYGAVDYLERQLLLKAYDKGNSENTIDYLRYLLTQSPDQRLLFFGMALLITAPNRSEVSCQRLIKVWQLSNGKYAEERFAPNCPERSSN